MAQKSATIRDVAQQAGVSVSTVSRILTGAETQIAISQETRARVLKAARELSYRPHPGARSLRGKTTNLLGLIVRQEQVAARVPVHFGLEVAVHLRVQLDATHHQFDGAGRRELLAHPADAAAGRARA